MVARALRFAELARADGLASALQIVRLRRARRQGEHFPAYVQLARLQHGLHVRPGTSDAHVFEQIFLDREYACLDSVENVGLVIDCGANVGYSAAYFLSRFPTSHVIAVEPDPGNAEALARNLAPYRDRARIVRAGVWSSPTELVVSDEQYRDGGEWARQVRPARPGEASDFRGVGIAMLLAEDGAARISILKVDIEGAEAVVFGPGYEAWIDQVDVIAIELHDDTVFGDAPAIFHEAIRGRGFSVSHSGELTICRRIPDLNS